MSGRTVRSLSLLLCLIGPAASAIAAITISGLQDKEVYANRVVFTVQSEADFEYVAQLNGRSVAVGAAVDGR